MSDRSNTNKIIIILLTIFTLIGGWIAYLCMKDDLEEKDRHVCKVLLIVFTSVYLGLVLLFIILSTIACFAAGAAIAGGGSVIDYLTL